MTKFKPTQELIEAVELVFTSMAYVQSVRPVVQEIQQKILDNGNYEVSEDKQHLRPELRTIKRDEDSWLMDDAQFQDYFTKCKTEYDEQGLTTETKEECPLLVAEDLERQDRRAMLQAAQYITNIDPSKVWKLEKLTELEQLTLRLVAPFVSKTEALNRLKININK